MEEPQVTAKDLLDSILSFVNQLRIAHDDHKIEFDADGMRSLNMIDDMLDSLTDEYLME